MDFRILGPLEVLDEGRRVALAGSKQVRNHLSAAIGKRGWV
jgi:DNA-binding SARP family transcriptional activator